MIRRNHNTAEAARRELVAHGFVDLHAHPSLPQVWARPRNTGGVRTRFVIEREDRARCSKFHIVPAE